MAMGACRECGKDVSTSAKVCPHCGVKRPVRRKGLGCFAVGLIVVAVLIGIGALVGILSYATMSPAERAQLDARERASATVSEDAAYNIHSSSLTVSELQQVSELGQHGHVRDWLIATHRVRFGVTTVVAVAEVRRLEAPGMIGSNDGVGGLYITQTSFEMARAIARCADQKAADGAAETVTNLVGHCSDEVEHRIAACIAPHASDRNANAWQVAGDCATQS